MPFQRSPFDDFMDTQCELVDGKAFYARLAGAAHDNDDGTSRQAALASLRSRDELQLMHEPENEFDSNAIRVSTPGGLQIGYLESRLAGETVRRQRKGILTRAFVSNVTGGRNGQSIGCTLGILTYRLL